MRSLLSSTLHRLASWIRPLRYKLVMMDVMRNMIMKIKVITMMNQSDNDDEPTKDELIDILEDVKNILTLREWNSKTCIRN
jgi:hypothetical protein